MKKRILALVLGLTVSTALAGCTSKAASTPPAAAPAASEAAKEETAEGEKYTIGINQFAVHGSLDNCREGFLQGLAEEGIVEGENLTVTYENAQADTGTAGQIADNFVANGVDMICAIATPSAASAYTATMKTEIPVIFTAVSDPIAAGLANADGTPVAEITGTSDKLPVEQQLEMIRKMLPDAKSIGIIYTTSEANSEATVKEYEAHVADYGFTLETVGISTTADIPLAADSLVSKVDCINNLTDNTVVQGLATVLSKANAAKIPVFGSEVEQVKNGCLAAVGIEYTDLGVQTGKMAAKVLKGEAKASQMNFELISECGLYVNKAVATELGITLDETYVGTAVESFDEIAK